MGIDSRKMAKIFSLFFLFFAITYHVGNCGNKQKLKKLGNKVEKIADDFKKYKHHKHIGDSVWLSVFHHNTAGGLFSGPDDALSKNVDNPSADLYSILEKLEDFKSGGLFHFRLCYPELVGVNGGDGCNEWTQTSNPATESTPTGFQRSNQSLPHFQSILTMKNGEELVKILVDGIMHSLMMRQIEEIGTVQLDLIHTILMTKQLQYLVPDMVLQILSYGK